MKPILFLREPFSRTSTGFLTLLIALGAVGVTAALSVRDAIAFERVNEQRQISERNEIAIDDVLSALTDAESGQRGFLLTGREYYLEPYNRAIIEAPGTIHRLADSTVDRADQAKRLEELESLIAAKLAELKRTIDLYRDGGKDAALALVLTDTGNNVMERIRKICSEFQVAAASRLTLQSQEAVLSARRTLIATTAEGVLMLSLLSLAAFSVHRETANRERLIGQLQYSEYRTRAQFERLDLLNHITRAIGERQDLKSIFQVAIRSLEENLPVDFACGCLYNAERKSLTVTMKGVKGQEVIFENPEIRLAGNGLSKCVEDRKVVYEPDISQLEFPFVRDLARGRLRAVVMAPLIVDDAVYGVLVAARLQPNSFASGECEFMQQLSSHVALSAHQAEILADLQGAYDDLRRTQQAIIDQERLRALGQMASGIAHDINNAMAPISLFTELVLEQEPSLSDQLRRYFEIAQRSVEDVAHTVRRLREYSRPRGSQEAFKPVDLNQMVEHVLDLTRAKWSDMALRKGAVIAVEKFLDPGLPAISGIESEIREAMTNLVFNAVDAMPNGGTLTLRTRADRIQNPARSASLEVQDSGNGMDDETRRRCLEPFFTTKGERGTGLGLAMVLGIATRHDAQLDIDSAPGQGTIVRLTFAVAVPATPEPTVVASPKLSPARILIVDDDPAIISLLKAALEGDGHTVVTADSGQDGIDRFLLGESSQPFDVVFTDLGMPHIDGTKVASAVKAARPSVPVILLTGWGQRLVDENEVPISVDRVLSKPPKLRDLRAALTEVMK